jgi:Fic family protein
VSTAAPLLDDDQDRNGLNRRDTRRRAEVVRNTLDEIVHGATATVTVQLIQDSLDISPEAAARILEHLVNAGLLVELRAGVWLRVSS